MKLPLDFGNFEREADFAREAIAGHLEDGGGFGGLRSGPGADGLFAERDRATTWSPNSDLGRDNPGPLT